MKSDSANQSQRIPRNRQDWWTDVAIAVAIAAVFLLLAGWRLSAPQRMVFDERFHARTAMDYLAGREPFHWVVAPLAELIIASGIHAFGSEFFYRSLHITAQQAFAARLPSLLFGALTLIVTYAFARSLSGRRSVGALAAMLLALDSLFLVHSRMAMTNIFEVCFVLVGTLGVWLYISTGRQRWLWFGGLGMGCAIAARWTGVFAWGFCGLFLLAHAWKERRRGLGRGILLIIASMVLLPMLVYMLAYVPYVLQGEGSWTHKLFTWHGNGHGWSRVVLLQQQMYEFMAAASGNVEFSSPWWSWPLMFRPIVYNFSEAVDGTVSGVWAIGNGLIWWASVPALAWALWRGWRERNKALQIVGVLGLGLWMEWGGIVWGTQVRKELYMHYMFESIPFACIALACLLQRWWNTGPTFKPPAPQFRLLSFLYTNRRGFVIAYIALTIAWAIFYYPVLTALPISRHFWQMHLWYGRIFDYFL